MSLLRVVHRWPAVPTQANTALVTTCKFTLDKSPVNSILLKSHHLDVGVVVHNQGVVPTKLQQVLAPSGLKTEFKTLIKSDNLFNTYLAQPLPQTCQPANKILNTYTGFKLRPFYLD